MKKINAFFDKLKNKWLEIFLSSVILGALHIVKVVWVQVPNIQADVGNLKSNQAGQGKVLCKMAIKDLSKKEEDKKELNEVTEICRNEIK